MTLTQDDLEKAEDKVDELSARVKDLESELEEYKRCVSCYDAASSA